MEENKTNIDLSWKKKLLLSGVFVQENRLHAILDRYLQDMTAKQWLVLVVADAYDVPPDLSTLGKMLGCSRQNIKQLALSLEKAGFAALVPSKSDGRSLCVISTEKGKQVIANSKNVEEQVHQALFRDFTEEDIGEYFRLSAKMMKGLQYLEEFFRELAAHGAL